MARRCALPGVLALDRLDLFEDGEKFPAERSEVVLNARRNLRMLDFFQDAVALQLLQAVVQYLR